LITQKHFREKIHGFNSKNELENILLNETQPTVQTDKTI